MRNPKNATRMRAVSPETVDHEAIDTMVSPTSGTCAAAPVPVECVTYAAVVQTNTLRCRGECPLPTLKIAENFGSLAASQCCLENSSQLCA